MSNEQKPLAPVLLTKEHDRKSFDCGVPPLNEYLQKYALQNQKKRSSSSYVSTVENRIVGYYSLAYGHVTPEEAPRNAFNFEQKDAEAQKNASPAPAPSSH